MTVSTDQPGSGYSENVSVGIVTRTKDRPLLLRRALDSVKGQSYPHWRLVVVNDGGDPAPVDALVAEIFGSDARVSVLHNPRSLGMEGASNAGLARLDTDLAAIHDDDDAWAPAMLSVATQALRTQNAIFPSVRGVVTRVNAVHETILGGHIRIDRVVAWQATTADPLDEGFVDLSRILMRNQFPPIAFLFDLAVCRALGGFDDTLPVLGDWEFHVRFASAHDIWVHPEALAFYHLRPTATGAFGNTVIAGKARHVLYATYLRNRWLRTALADDGPGAVAAAMIRAAALQAEATPAHGRRARVGSPRKQKGKMAEAFSNLNRWRKRYI